jgi:hypothetical protein
MGFSVRTAHGRAAALQLANRIAPLLVLLAERGVLRRAQSLLQNGEHLRHVAASIAFASSRQCVVKP